MEEKAQLRHNIRCRPLDDSSLSAQSVGRAVMNDESREAYSISMQKTLILKLGALGDVLRTTTLLHILPPEITWVTSGKSAPLLENNPLIKNLCLFENLDTSLLEEPFDLLINLEDEMAVAQLAAKVRAAKRLGPYATESGIAYDAAARPWFDLSLSSRFGKDKADLLKRENQKSYQELIFSMLDNKFEGQDYVLHAPQNVKTVPGLVGIERRVGDVWPMKQWNKFDALERELQRRGFHLKFFEQRPRLQEYIKDVQKCEVVVSGDTLAMHVALALRKKAVAIFTCTSPQEIYDYGRLIKVVSPLWKKYFYRREFVSEAADAISLEAVMSAVLAQTAKRPGEN